MTNHRPKKLRPGHSNAPGKNAIQTNEHHQLLSQSLKNPSVRHKVLNYIGVSRRLVIMWTENDADTSPAKSPRKARQKKEQVIPKPSDFAPRLSSPWKVGAHVSAAGGVENAIVNAARVRCVPPSPCFAFVVIRHHRANAFALFVKSQRKWSSPPLADESVASFKERMKEFGYDPKYILPHGSYLINLGNPDTYVPNMRPLPPV